MINKSLYSTGDAEASTVARNVINQNRALIVAFFLILLYPIFFDWWRSRDTQTVTSITIQNMQILSEDKLCPGDKLIFRYDLAFEGSGVLIIDLTLWRVDPPKTVIFSEGRRFILPNTITQQSLVESWKIPEEYQNFELDEERELAPGLHQRQLAISNLYDENVGDIDWIEFTVLPKEICYARSQEILQ